MRNFIYKNETEIIFGKNTEETVGSKLKNYTNKVLLHYGGGSIKTTGLYDKVITSLKKDIDYHYEISRSIIDMDKADNVISLTRSNIYYR